MTEERDFACRLTFHGTAIWVKKARVLFKFLVVYFCIECTGTDAIARTALRRAYFYILRSCRIDNDVWLYWPMLK
jgi:hypothetical protein